MTTNQDFVIEQGKTFAYVLRWEVPPIVYKPITAITAAAPAAVTCTAHGLKDGWRASIVSVKGMTQINAAHTPPRAADARRVTVIDANTVTFNDINAAGFTPYTSGGYLQYNTPADLTGFTARMSVKDVVGGTELLRLDTINGRIVLDAAANTITLAVTALITAALTPGVRVYDLEMVSAAGIVTALIQGTVSIIPEVTTT